jgi:hypothetical protein
MECAGAGGEVAHHRRRQTGTAAASARVQRRTPRRRISSSARRHASLSCCRPALPLKRALHAAASERVLHLHLSISSFLH